MAGEQIESKALKDKVFYTGFFHPRNKDLKLLNYLL